eukprot:6682313-Prymnesium_polylepis.2
MAPRPPPRRRAPPPLRPPARRPTLRVVGVASSLPPRRAPVDQRDPPRRPRRLSATGAGLCRPTARCC